MKERFSALRRVAREGRAGQIVGIVLAILFVPLIYFATEMYNYKSARLFFRFVRLHPGSALLGLLLVTFLYGFFMRTTKVLFLVKIGEVSS